MQTITLRTLARVPRIATTMITPRIIVTPIVTIVPTLVRTMATGKSSKKVEELPQDLSSVLNREIQYEKENSSAEAKLAEVQEVLNGWKIVDNVGSARFTVSKKVSIYVFVLEPNKKKIWVVLYILLFVNIR